MAMNESPSHPNDARLLWALSVAIAVASALLVFFGLRRLPRRAAAPALAAAPPAAIPTRGALPLPNAAAPSLVIRAPWMFIALLMSGCVFVVIGNGNMASDNNTAAFLWCLVAGMQWAVALETSGVLRWLLTRRA